MFGYPRLETQTFCEVVSFLESNKSIAIGVFPWFTAEIIYRFGSKDALVFLEKWGSRRVPVKTVLETLNGDPIFRKIVRQNCADGDYIEVQSASSFWNGLRTIKLQADCIDLSPAEAAAITGLSMRTVQRYLRDARHIQQKVGAL